MTTLTSPSVPSPTDPSPTNESARIASLDVLRGFALCGILLLNILAFGLHSAAYFNPTVDGATSGVNFYAWAGVDVLFEGAMRCLFSILFGAGVLLFTGTGRSGALHYRRNFWLLVFGLVDVTLLLWLGDILVTYALAGAILYLARDLSVRALTTAAFVVVMLMSLQYAAMGFGLEQARNAAESSNPETANADLIRTWQDFSRDFAPDERQISEELSTRQSGYAATQQWTLGKVPALLTFQIPVFTLWDALAMMLLGMALFKANVLDASRSTGFYLRGLLAGLSIGLVVNLYEVWNTVRADFDILVSFPFLKPSYQIGRLGMAFAYLCLIMLICRLGLLTWLRSRLASLGRMALTNYLAHSLICLFLFTGLGLVGTLDRWFLYVIVVTIWLVQLVWSHWWLARFRFGPLEWLWRFLTYGDAPPLRR